MSKAASDQYPSELPALYRPRQGESKMGMVQVTLRTETEGDLPKDMDKEELHKTIKVKKLLTEAYGFTGTSANPVDPIWMHFWEHRMVNAIMKDTQLALVRMERSDNTRLLFEPGAHSTTVPVAGDTRNLMGRLICNPILLDNPYVSTEEMEDDLRTFISQKRIDLASRASGQGFGPVSEQDRAAHMARAQMELNSMFEQMLAGVKRV